MEGLSIGPSSTGELRAVIEFFGFFLFYSSLNRGDIVVVYTDSQYVLDLLDGSSLPSSHPQLIKLAQQFYTALRVQFSFKIAKVPGHKVYPGNEMADVLAKRGVTRTATAGRFPCTPSRPFKPPDIRFNQLEFSYCSTRGCFYEITIHSVLPSYSRSSSLC